MCAWQTDQLKLNAIESKLRGNVSLHGVCFMFADNAPSQPDTQHMCYENIQFLWIGRFNQETNSIEIKR